MQYHQLRLLQQFRDDTLPVFATNVESRRAERRPFLTRIADTDERAESF